MEAKHTPGPWEYVASNEHHGPYVVGPYGRDVCDCYTMSNPMAASVRNGGTSYPIHHHGEDADANARLIAAAPDLLAQHNTNLVDLDLLRRAIAEGDPKAELLVRVDDLIRFSRDAITKAEPSHV